MKTETVTEEIHLYENPSHAVKSEYYRFITLRDGHLWIQHSEGEGMALSYEAFDKFFKEVF